MEDKRTEWLKNYTAGYNSPFFCPYRIEHGYESGDNDFDEDAADEKRWEEKC